MLALLIRPCTCKLVQEHQRKNKNRLGLLINPANYKLVNLKKFTS